MGIETKSSDFTNNIPFLCHYLTFWNTFDFHWMTTVNVRNNIDDNTSWYDQYVLHQSTLSSYPTSNTNEKDLGDK